MNFKRGIIRADKQLSWKRKDDEDRELVSTKNSKAREITPPAAVVEKLHLLQKKQAEWKLRAGN